MKIFAGVLIFIFIHFRNQSWKNIIGQRTHTYKYHASTMISTGVFCIPVPHKKDIYNLGKIKNVKCTYPVFKISDDYLSCSRIQKCLCLYCLRLKTSKTDIQYLPFISDFEFFLCLLAMHKDQKSFPFPMTLRGISFWGDFWGISFPWKIIKPLRSDF